MLLLKCQMETYTDIWILPLKDQYLLVKHDWETENTSPYSVVMKINGIQS